MHQTAVPVRSMSRPPMRLGIAALTLLLTAGIARAVPAPQADHHMHIQSALITAHLKDMQTAMPQAFQGISDDIFEVRTGPDALRELDKAQIRQGVLLSTAYMFGFAATPLPPETMASRMRAENRFNVDAALASDGRLIAFVGINPFSANALDELRYWAGQPGASGVKLHLANSLFDPAKPEQVATLATFVTAARDARMPLVVHLRGGAPFDKAGITRFIDEVLSQAGDLPVQIAHGGGFGGVDQPTLDALALFGAAIARQAPGTANLVLDLAAVATLDPSKMPPAKPADLRSIDELRKAYVAGMRKIGLERFVLGSDWPAIAPPADYFALEQKLLPVTPGEWRQLSGNLAPYLRAEWRRP